MPFPRRPWLIGVLALCAASGIPGGFAADRPPGMLREEVLVQATPLDRVEISFVVRDRAGRTVAGLGKDDLRLSVDGAPTPLESVDGTLQASKVPLSIAFLIDVSGSMARLERERFLAGARALLARLRPMDAMMLVTFADEPRVACDFSNDPAVLSGALETVPGPDGGTNLRRALETAEDRLSARAGHGVVVLYSDGAAPVGGTLSVPPSSGPPEGAARRTVPLYWIVPHFQGFGAVQRNGGLRNLVARSGGRWILESGGIESALIEVGTDLSARYEASFFVDVAKHRRRIFVIDLEALRPGTTVQAPEVVERSVPVRRP